MTLYLYSNLLGTFIFNGDGNLLGETRFKKDYLENYRKLLSGEWIHEEGALIEKHRSEKAEDAKVVNHKNEMFYDASSVDLDTKDSEVVEKIFAYFIKPDLFNELRTRNLKITRQDMQTIPVRDILIIQAVNNVEELDHSINTMAKRLREWYELYLPEASRSIQDHKKFAELVSRRPKEELMKELNIKESMGVEMSANDLEPVYKLADQIINLFDLKQNQSAYIESLLDDYCPNLKAICGVSIAAKLLSLARSLKKLSAYPSSTVQTLGAEKAMFRHLRSGSKPPKYGVILMHPLVISAGRNKGKIARMLANKISLAAKVDFFKGDDYKGYELKQALEKKIQKLKR